MADAGAAEPSGPSGVWRGSREPGGRGRGGGRRLEEEGETQAARARCCPWRPRAALRRELGLVRSSCRVTEATCGPARQGAATSLSLQDRSYCHVAPLHNGPFIFGKSAHVHAKSLVFAHIVQ